MYGLIPIFVTFCSQVWILEGDNGKVKKQWPFRVGYGLTATPLITQLTPTSVIDVVSNTPHEGPILANQDNRKLRYLTESGGKPLSIWMLFDEY